MLPFKDLIRPLTDGTVPAIEIFKHVTGLCWTSFKNEDFIVRFWDTESPGSHHEDYVISVTNDHLKIEISEGYKVTCWMKTDTADKWKNTLNLSGIEVWRYLQKLHFDIEGLIEQRKAFDINEVPQKVYDHYPYLVE